MSDRTATVTHLTSLDGLRGVAALAVAFFHAQGLLLGQSWLPHGGLAVDFFFVLSGFVLAYANDHRFASGLTARAFMLRRVIRLYPLAVLGALIGLAVGLLPPPQRPDARAIYTVVSGLLLLPYWGQLALGQPPWPLNPPSWSLFQELIASGVLAVLGTRIPNRALVALILGCGLAALAVDLMIAGQPRLTAVWVFSATPRALYSFLAGVAIWRLNLTSRRFVLPAWLSAITILAAMTLPIRYHAAELVCVFALFPLLVSLTTNAAATRLKLLYDWLGQISYPLYAVHLPIFIWLTNSGLLTPLRGHATLLAALLVAGASGLAWLLLKLFDEPVRAWLTHRLIGRWARPSALHETVTM